MTMAEIRAMDKPFLTPAEAAGVLGCDPHLIRVAARDNPKMLGFPVVRVGSRTKIPRIPFLQVMGGTQEETT